MNTWISVEDCEPDSDRNVLTWSKYDGYCVGYLWDGLWWKLHAGVIDVSHWMELPEKPLE